MRGGTLTVEGDAGPHAGSGMRGGRLEVFGGAGDHLGAPLAGELAGMNGGVLVVRGKAGAFAADRMRRGLIAVLRGCRRLCRQPHDRRHAGGGRRRRRDARLSDAARLDPARPRAEEPVAELRRMRRAATVSSQRSSTAI